MPAALRSLTCALWIVWLNAGCGAPLRSIGEFGGATETMAESVALTARDSAALCEHKRNLDLEEKVILGEYTAKQVLARLDEDPCTKFRRTSAFYAALARQLGAFALAMKTLAQEGEADYTEQLSSLTGSAQDVGLDPKYQPRVAAAAGLTQKLLSWFSQSYAAGKIGHALEESEPDVAATLELLLAMLDVYDVQLKGYRQLIEQVSVDPDFETPRPNEPAGLDEQRKRAQVELVKVHAAYAKQRRQLLAASRKAVLAVKELHVDLVAEAKRRSGEFDSKDLLGKARRLSGEVAELRSLALQITR